LDDPPPRIRVSEDFAARRKKDEDFISARRQRLGLSPIRKSRSKTPEVYSKIRRSPEQNGNDDSDDYLKQKSVSDLKNKYDNGYGSSREDEDETDSSTRRKVDTSRESPPARSYRSTFKGLESPSVDRKSNSPVASKHTTTNGYKVSSITSIIYINSSIIFLELQQIIID